MKLQWRTLLTLSFALVMGTVALQSAHLSASTPEEIIPETAGAAEESGPVATTEAAASATGTPLAARIRGVLELEQKDLEALATELASTEDLEHRRRLQRTIDLRKQEAELQVMELQLEALSTANREAQAETLSPVVERMRLQLRATREHHERLGLVPRTER